jgi:hypothetical protein
MCVASSVASEPSLPPRRMPSAVISTVEFYFSFANVRPCLGASSEARRVPASTPSLGSSPAAAVDVSGGPASFFKMFSCRTVVCSCSQNVLECSRLVKFFTPSECTCEYDNKTRRQSI